MSKIFKKLLISSIKYNKKNQDGKISFSELRSAFQGEIGTNSESIKNLIQDADEDQNNEISYEEFAKMMKQTVQNLHKNNNE